MNTGGNVYQITGPPGTGKTETLARKTQDAVLMRGRRVAIASLTNTAAAEIRDRTGLIDPSMVAVGTLHKMAMEALGVSATDLVVSHIAEWNEQHRGSWAITQKSKRSAATPFDAPEGETHADQFLERIDLERHRMVPTERWRPYVGQAQFWEKFCAWKAEHGYLDFTDLFERAVLDTSYPLIGKEKADTLVLDECQDQSRLELHLCRDVWGKNVERVVMAGDPDQALFTWRGADPRVFLDHPVGADHEQVLTQSYRVPRQIHAYAQSLIRRIHGRKNVHYLPRDEEGEVLRYPGESRLPERFARSLEKWLRDGTVMFLAATQFPLRPVVSWLRSAGIPFGNPWAPDRGDWNPMRGSRRGEVSTLDRFLAYLAPGRSEWSRADILRWIPILRAGGLLARGSLAHLSDLLSDPWLSSEFVALFQEEAQAVEAYARAPKWLASNAKPAKTKLIEYLARVHAKAGVGALMDPPAITIGTVHSVKGAAADTVVLFPDVTPAMYEDTSREGADAQTRTFYVGATRARHRLVIAQPSSRMHYTL